MKLGVCPAKVREFRDVPKGYVSYIMDTVDRFTLAEDDPTLIIDHVSKKTFSIDGAVDLLNLYEARLYSANEQVSSYMWDRNPDRMGR